MSPAPNLTKPYKGGKNDFFLLFKFNLLFILKMFKFFKKNAFLGFILCNIYI